MARPAFGNWTSCRWIMARSLSETGRSVGGSLLGLVFGNWTSCRWIMARSAFGNWMSCWWIMAWPIFKKEVIQFWLQIIQSIEFDGKKLRKIRNRSLKDGINFCLLCKAMTATESLISRFSCLLFGTLLDV